MELGKETDRKIVISALLQQIQNAFDHLFAPQGWMEAYRKNCITLGKEVQIIRGEEVHQGFAESMDDILETAKYYCNIIIPDMNAIHLIADSVEEYLPDDVLPYPNYEQLLFSL